MPNKNTTLANITRIVDVDANYWPTLVKTANLGTGTADNTTFLRGDRTWATPTEMGVVSSVGMTVPTGFSVAGSPITTAGTLAVTYSGLIPTTSLGTGTANNTSFLRGDQTWAVPSEMGLVSSVGMTVPTGFMVSGSPITSSGTLAVTYSGVIPATSLGINTPAATNFLRGDGTWNAPVVSVVSDNGTTPRVGALKLISGTNVTIIDNADGSFTFNAIGGGGGTFNTTVAWASGGSSKAAYTSPGVVNTQGITISLVGTSGSGQLTNLTISLNGVALTNTYTSTGAFPNYTVTIPAADLTGNVAETASSVIISILGTFTGSGLNLPNVGTLTNIQAVPFTTTLNVSYSPNVVAFYVTTSTINYSYTNQANITQRDGTITPVGGTQLLANNNASSFPNQPVNGAAIGGQARGNGTNGAGLGTVTFNSSLPAVTFYTPAFYAQTANSTPPTFTTASSQTPSNAQGATVTFPIATAMTQYDWICTQRPLANIRIITPFGTSPLVPDVTAPTQTISGQVFNVYGFTRLSTSVAAQLVIS